MKAILFLALVAMSTVSMFGAEAVPFDEQDEAKTIAYFLSLKKKDIGKLSAMMPTGTGEAAKSRLIGFRALGKQHVYLFQSKAGTRAFAWVDKGGKPLPIPRLEEGSRFEHAYAVIGEVYTTPEVHSGDGVVILTAATKGWMEGLKAPAAKKK
jgi:hypothetical protein